ncbi:hypothetical protein [Methylorubrum zatmanii]
MSREPSNNGFPVEGKLRAEKASVDPRADRVSTGLTGLLGMCVLMIDRAGSGEGEHDHGREQQQNNGKREHPAWHRDDPPMSDPDDRNSRNLKRLLAKRFSAESSCRAHCHMRKMHDTADDGPIALCNAT